MIDPKTFLEAVFEAAVEAADPLVAVPKCLPDPPPNGRTVVIGAGKASAVMARAVERHYAENWPDAPISGTIVTRYGFDVPCDTLRILQASHPVPDQAGAEAAEEILKTVSGLTADDQVLCLISGGGSALLTAPVEGLTLDEKMQVNSALLASGAPIQDMNCIRKHLSKIKGGQLAAACAPAAIYSILISDVPGDDPQVIASGPTVPDHTTFTDALRLVRYYDMPLPASAMAHLEAGIGETPKPGDPIFDRAEIRMAATPRLSLEAAARVAEQHGITPVILGDAIEGESREVGRVLAGIAKSVRDHGDPVSAPTVLLSGGETTVTLRAKGRGGPNSECALGMALALDGLAGTYAICCDTDGIDGSEDNAGAWITPETLTKAREAGLDPAIMLRDNNAYDLFQAVDGLVVTGPSGTNVNDLRAVLILPE